MSKSAVRTKFVNYVRKAFKYLFSLRVLNSVGLAIGLFPPRIPSVSQATNDQCHIASNRPRLLPLVTPFGRAIGSKGFSSVDRFHSSKHGLKRLVKVECELEKKRKRKTRRYNKSYPGSLVHFDFMSLPLIKGESRAQSKEYLCVAIDDFSRELYAGIFPDKPQYSFELFLRQVVDECPYAIECACFDSGKEFRRAGRQAFEKACIELGIRQKFVWINQPQSYGKAERVLQAITKRWRQQKAFHSRKNRRVCLQHFIKSYNLKKLHKGGNNMPPKEIF